jgi:hypothetical protein
MDKEIELEMFSPKGNFNDYCTISKLVDITTRWLWKPIIDNAPTFLVIQCPSSLGTSKAIGQVCPSYTFNEQNSKLKERASPSGC